MGKILSKIYDILELIRNTLCMEVHAAWFRTEAQMRIFEHAGINRSEPAPTVMPEERLPPGIAILAIGALSLLSWALFISIGLAVRSIL